LYNKLFTRILDSSVWLEDDATRIVWITLLAAMDEDGFCRFASPANVALRARVSPAAAAAALKKFENPDPMTPEDENEGRRIERVPGGWIVLNAVKHREQVTRDEIRRQDAARAKRYRERKRSVTDERVAIKEKRDAAMTGETDITPPALRKNAIRHGPVAQSVAVSEAEAKKQGRAAAAAFAKETAAKRNALIANAPNHHGSNRTNYDRRDTSGNAESVRRFLDELAAEDAGSGAGSNLGLPAASVGDAGAQPIEERAVDVPSSAGGPEPGTDRPSLFPRRDGVQTLPRPGLAGDFTSIGEPVAAEGRCCPEPSHIHYCWERTCN
jgi:hypothetical protein